MMTSFIKNDSPRKTKIIKKKKNFKFQLVVDHETWVMNLKEANLYDYPIWYKLYSARKAYSMTSLLPQDWDELLTRLTTENDLFDTYYK